MDPISIGLGVLGLGVGLFSSYSQAKSQRDMYNQQMSALQGIKNGSAQPAQASMPKLPAAPTADNGGANEEAARAREETLRQAAAHNQSINPTGGLGLTGLPNLHKRTLGGAA